MTRRDWWIGIGVVVVVLLLVAWIVPKRIGDATVDAAAERIAGKQEELVAFGTDTILSSVAEMEQQAREFERLGDREKADEIQADIAKLERENPKLAAAIEGSRRADRNAAATQVGFYKTAVERYKLDTRNYPPNLQALIKAPANATGWGGPYMDKIAHDPWDGDYQYATPGKHNPDSFDVWSAGRDARDGTDDDIGNWD